MISILATMALLAGQQQASAEQIYEAATPSVLTLSIERPHGAKVVGTAFLAVRKGVAVTAWHVLRGAVSVTAKFSDGHVAKVGGIIDKDSDHDVAFIQIDSGDRPVLKLAEGDPRVGAKAYVIGSPKGMDFSISDGIISQMPLLNSGKLYQFTCPVSPGNSGGPLLNGVGQVLGVVSWQLRDAQNLNFAVPTATLARLDALKTALPFNVVETATGKTSEEVLVATDTLISGLLKRLDLECEPSDDGTGKTVYLFEVEGTKVSLFQYASDGKNGPTVNVALSVGYQVGDNSDLKLLNDFNRQHRFARCYRDGGGVLYLENDLDLEKGVGAGTFLRFVADFRSTLSQFEDEVLGPGHKAAGRLSLVQPDERVADIGDKDLIEVLKGCGYQAETSDDGTGKQRFTFKIGKVEAALYQFADGKDGGPTTSLTLSLGYDVEGEAKLEAVNRFNEQSRFSKAFLDVEGDPFLVADLDLQGGVTKEAVKAFVTGFAKSAPTFQKLVVGSD